MKELDAQSTLQVLEGRTRKLERRLGFAICGWLLTVGVVLVSAWTWQSKSETVDILRARQIVIVDEKGRERILLGAPVPKVAGRKRQDDATGMLVLGEDGADRVAVGYAPDPQYQGKVVKRISPQAGITFNDKTGAERGGFGVFDDGSVHLGLDYPTGREAVSLFAGDSGVYSGLLVASDNKGGAERAGIVVNNKSGRVVLKLADTKSDERLMIDVVGDSAAKFILRDPAKNTTVNLIEKLKP
jgi:hypothetical protein